MKRTVIYTYSIVYSSCELFQDQTPYVTAILEDEAGRRFPAFLGRYPEGKAVAVGQEVDFQGYDRDGDAVYRLIPTQPS